MPTLQYAVGRCQGQSCELSSGTGESTLADLACSVLPDAVVGLSSYGTFAVGAVGRLAIQHDWVKWRIRDEMMDIYTRAIYFTFKNLRASKS